MTRRHLMTLRLLLVFTDAAVAALVFWLVSRARFEVDQSVQWSVGIDVGPAAVLFAITWVGVFLALGHYRLRVRWSMLAEAKDILWGTVVVIGLTLSLLFLFRQPDVSRLFLLMVFVAQPSVTLVGRTFLRRWFERQRMRGRDTGYMLVVGTGPLAAAFADRIEAHRALGMRVVGHLHVGALSVDDRPTRRIVGSVDDLHAILHREVVDEVAVCLEADEAHFLEPVVAMAAEEGKTVRVPRAVEEGVLSGALREEFDGYLVHSVLHHGQRDLELVVKRTLDVLGSFVALVLLSPVFLVVALATYFRDGSPILFRQTRVGRHGRPFTLLKFRTMQRGAEELVGELVERNEVRGPAFKIRDDPRVTPLGRFLRRTSLDELPQFFNVLRGEMSLVGPRPALPAEVQSYDIWHRRRLSVRPGMTGLWQVEARGNDDFDERAALDLRYIDQWSMWQDLRIIARTLPAVVARRGS